MAYDRDFGDILGWLAGFNQGHGKVKEGLAKITGTGAGYLSSLYFSLYFNFGRMRQNSQSNARGLNPSLGSVNVCGFAIIFSSRSVDPLGHTVHNAVSITDLVDILLRREKRYAVGPHDAAAEDEKDTN